MTKVLCLEGITGAGKTTQARKISNFLNLGGYSHLIINEKQYEPFRQRIIDWHNSGANQNFTKEMIESIAKARGETHKRHFTHLLGILNYIIFDRSLYTSGVYESDGELTPEEIIKLNLKAGAIKLQSGIIILCSPEVARKRIDERRLKNNQYNLPSMHETIDEITKRRELYLELAKQHPELYLIDSTDKTEDDIFNELREKLKL